MNLRNHESQIRSRKTIDIRERDRNIRFCEAVPSRQRRGELFDTYGRDKSSAHVSVVRPAIDERRDDSSVRCRPAVEIATGGAATDNHSVGSPFVTPYSASSFTAVQYYRYRCPCRNNGNYVNIMGPINIVRSVSNVSGAGWKYTITKSGASATINPLP